MAAQDDEPHGHGGSKLAAITQQTLVPLGLAALFAVGGFWFRDREASTAEDVSSKLSAVGVEIVAANKSVEALEKQIASATREIMAKLDHVASQMAACNGRVDEVRVAAVTKDSIATWAILFQARNPTVNVPEWAR